MYAKDYEVKPNWAVARDFSSDMQILPAYSGATTRFKLSDAVAYEPSAAAFMQYSGEPKEPHDKGY